MKQAPSLLQLIPDIFFDALAYILPASLLFIGVMITSLFSRQWIGLLASGILFFLFVHEAYGEQVFFTHYLQEMTKELRELEPPPQQNESNS
jgi:hypothetical protein